jgi:hypothetical protein
MKKLTILLIATLFAAPVFAEEAKVETPVVEDTSKAAPAEQDAKAQEESVAADATKTESTATTEEVKKEVKADTAKKSKHGMKKHKSSKNYTVVPEKKYTVVPVK